MFKRLWCDQGGASSIDYSILVALIEVIVVDVVSVAGTRIQGMRVHLLQASGAHHHGGRVVFATSFNARDADWLSWFSSEITQISAPLSCPARGTSSSRW
jgi:Flp pilus assembly pilin Flp